MPLHIFLRVTVVYIPQSYSGVRLVVLECKCVFFSSFTHTRKVQGGSELLLISKVDCHAGFLDWLVARRHFVLIWLAPNIGRQITRPILNHTTSTQLRNRWFPLACDPLLTRILFPCAVCLIVLPLVLPLVFPVVVGIPRLSFLFPLVAGLLASTLFRTLVVRERVIEYRTDRVCLSLCEWVCTSMSACLLMICMRVCVEPWFHFFKWYRNQD